MDCVISRDNLPILTCSNGEAGGWREERITHTHAHTYTHVRTDVCVSRRKPYAAPRERPKTLLKRGMAGAGEERVIHEALIIGLERERRIFSFFGWSAGSPEETERERERGQSRRGQGMEWHTRGLETWLQSLDDVSTER